MYEVSVSVGACGRGGGGGGGARGGGGAGGGGGPRADVAWVVAGDGPEGSDAGEALAITPGGGRIGTLLGGALDDQIAGLVADGTTRRLLDLAVDPVGALVTGVPSGTRARCLLVPAADFPEETWDELFAGRPACLVVGLDGERVTNVERYDEGSVADLGEEVARFFSRGVTGSLVAEDRVVTALWPVPRLAVLGGGPIGDALLAAAEPLGWKALRFDSPAEAAPALLGFGPLDLVVVGLHDVAAAGAALAAALSGGAGYVGGLGTPEMNAARLDWLVSRSVTGVERLHGPAGLDLGARRPAEVAVSVIAEALATRHGRSGRPLGGSGLA